MGIMYKKVWPTGERSFMTFHSRQFSDSGWAGERAGRGESLRKIRIGFRIGDKIARKVPWKDFADGRRREKKALSPLMKL